MKNTRNLDTLYARLVVLQQTIQETLSAYEDAKPVPEAVSTPRAKVIGFKDFMKRHIASDDRNA